MFDQPQLILKSQSHVITMRDFSVSDELYCLGHQTPCVNGKVV